MKKGILLLFISVSLSLGFECKTYVVKQGDTLARIARSEGVDLQKLKSANKGIQEDKLKVGQTLCIPVSKRKDKGYAVYEVQKGDTLEEIARNFGVDVQTLKEYNNLKDDRIVEGQKIKIPPKGKAKKEENYHLYTVKRGGKLSDVAKATGVPLRELERLNPELKDKTLKPGTQVKVPQREVSKKDRKDKEESYELYTVKKGGKLEHVAKATGTPLKELERLNPELKGKWLEPGTQVKVPESRKKEVEKEKYEIYSVKRGGRLEDVAKSKGVPLKDLERLNPELKDKWLKPGTQVKIPLKETEREKEYTLYTLKNAGKLSDVAKATGTPLRELEKLNPEFKDKNLKPGTQVKVPVVEEKQARAPQESAPSRKEERGVVSEMDKGNTTAPQLPPKDMSLQMPVEGKVAKVPKGLEISAPCSTPIKAVEEGRVIYSGGDLQAYGNMIIVEHERFISLYAYNEVNLVKRGERVSKGQVIARLGKKVNSEECTLRFEIRSKEGIPIDPTEYIKDIQ